ncbi:MAG: AAA family ATPase [Deferrisomatales bacterium]|nr:AAA family ATPase [Deferrisomatales bacterium]
MTVREISERLTARVEEIAAYLLPGGCVQGREWVAGSVNGEKGKSLKVCLSGDKRGVWADFAAGVSGDLLDLWQATRGLGIAEAVKEVKDYLGIEDPVLNRPPAKQYRRPTPPTAARKATTFDPVREYLVGERKLTPEALAAYKIGGIAEVGPFPGWKKQEPWRGPWIVFPFLRGGELLGIKYLHLERREGKKQTLVEPGCEPTCFGWHAIDPHARTLTICEGELDAASLWQYGHPALSVPFGGGKGDKQQWVSHDWERLEAYETINLVLDQDEEGRAAVVELLDRLGLHRCRIVTLPYKDANACLQAGVTREEIDACFEAGTFMDPPSLKRAREFADAVVDQFYPGENTGLLMPWTHCKFRVLRGELSVWTGWNGSGKSLLLGQVMLFLLEQGERCVIASLEMRSSKTLWRMVRQMLCDPLPTKDAIVNALDWLGDRLWLHDKVGHETVESLLPIFEYAHRRFGVRQFVVDSLMRCGVGEDDYAGQKRLVEQLTEFADRTNTHVHLVAHSRKGANEGAEVGKMDVKGTGAITDIAFNVFSVWRNKPKEEIIQKHHNHEPVTLPKGYTIETVKEEQDASLRCDKARNVEDGEGRWPLWFDKPSFLYLGPADRPTPMPMTGDEPPPF